jgi:hypothetical protein
MSGILASAPEATAKNQTETTGTRRRSENEARAACIAYTILMADYWGVDENDDSEEAWLERDRNFGAHIQPLVDGFRAAAQDMKRAAEEEDRQEVAQLEEMWSLPATAQP